MLLREYARYGATHGAALENIYNNTVFGGMAGMSVEDALLRVQRVPMDATIIASHQKAIFKKLRGINNTSSNSSINKLNKSLMSSFNSFNFSAVINQNIAQIEQYVLTLGAGQTTTEEALNKLRKNFSPLNTEIDKLIEEARLFFKQLKSYGNMEQIAFAFNALDNRLAALQSKVRQQIDNNNQGISMPNKDDFLSNLIWTEYIIKGEYLEQVGKEYFSKIIPLGWRVLQTGRLGGYIDLMGNYHASGAMKSDLMILDGENFIIEFHEGEGPAKHMGIDEFITYIGSHQGSKQIQLTEHSFHELHAHLKAGIQAKATRTERIKFGKVNLLNAAKEDEGYALLALYSVHKAEKAKQDSKKYPLFTNHAAYNALYNYNLARNLNYVVGKNNTLLLTRTGLEDMNTFILKQFDRNRYFYGADYNLNKQTSTVALDFV